LYGTSNNGRIGLTSRLTKLSAATRPSSPIDNPLFARRDSVTLISSAMLGLSCMSLASAA
jgi:hypothetical protein